MLIHVAVAFLIDAALIDIFTRHTRIQLRLRFATPPLRCHFLLHCFVDFAILMPLPPFSPLISLAARRFTPCRLRHAIHTTCLICLIMLHDAVDDVVIDDFLRCCFCRASISYFAAACAPTQLVASQRYAERCCLMICHIHALAPRC